MGKINYSTKRRAYINYLLDTLGSEDYKHFIESNEQYKTFIEQKKQLSIWEVKFFDTFENKEMNHLVKGISKLNKSEYDVELYLRPKNYKDLNYLRLQYDYTSVALLAKVKPLNDDFIREITLGYTQINNNQIVIEFTIEFKKIMDEKLLISFIETNKDKLYNMNFVNYYGIEASKNFHDIYRQYKELLKATYQAKLSSIFNLNFGNEYELPSCVIINYPEKLFSKDAFKDVFLCETYEIRNGEQYMIIDITSREGLEMEIFFSGRFYSPISFLSIISKFRMNLYYFLFNGIENAELNRRINKYFNESKTRISSKDYKWLVNKIRAINDNKLHMNRANELNSEVKEWKVYYRGEERELEFSKNSYSNKYEIIYTECLEHIKIINSLRNESLVIKVASWSLIASLIGVGLTLFQIIK
ncbi:hypothetical protein P4V54_20135 [Brevibacillus nitrificans]|uniref:hypothetical protein n=1 Tax=Brevibacillus nitrificans TaxID=651560 RepID=UPI002E1CF1B1|nr:hypothetical protein [Brevibacillus nitrificans]